MRQMRLNRPHFPTWLPVITFTGWSALVVVGLLGFTMPYARPAPPLPEPELPPVEVLEVQLSDDPVTQPDLPAPAPDMQEPPPLLDPINPPDAPPLAAVAEPSDMVAFALPVEAPARVVDADQAAWSRQAVEQPTANVSAPPVQSISFGRGEGDQPKPRYPRQARREGQEGTVTVIFSVGQNGRVMEAALSRPSPWPLLNQEALRVIRERWRFPSGAVRRYEVSIRFELTK